MSEIKTETNTTRSQRAGLLFPVGLVHQHLEKGGYAMNISYGAPVYLAAVLEYVTKEILESAGHCAQNDNRTSILPRDLHSAVRSDESLSKLIGVLCIPKLIGVLCIPKGAVKNVNN